MLSHLRRWIHTKPFNEQWLAKPKAPELEQDPGLCTDGHSSCANWAASGECDKNPAYMKVRASARAVKLRVPAWTSLTLCSQWESDRSWLALVAALL